ncbi:MAG: EAL domain-containing protein [Sphingomonadales bacterium]|nr:EAL domain-containing protein [Sphingomonadales bacterium]
MEITKVSCCMKAEPIWLSCIGCDLGIKVALDDFRTGYSSLNYLRTSRSTRSRSTAVSSMTLKTGRIAARLSSAVIGLAGNLAPVTLAEGVEGCGPTRTIAAGGLLDGSGLSVRRGDAAGHYADQSLGTACRPPTRLPG